MTQTYSKKSGEKNMKVLRNTTECPRCSQTMLLTRAALSRLDNTTYVCSTCGVDEAIEQWVTGTIANYKLGETK
jgi:predicted RNA-binding Zn-ribbon protein involved in translation (DUF1610 family)